VERYKDHSGKWRKVSLTHMKKNNSVKKEMTKRLQDKIDKKLATNSNKKITFKEVSKEWLTLYKQTVKYNTYRNFKSKLNTINPVLGDIEISQLTAGTINKYLLKQLNDGLSYVTVNLKLFTIKQVINHALKYGYINEDNITNKLYIPKINQSKKDNLKYLEIDELKEVIKQLSGNPTYQMIAKVLANTGLRYGELVAIRTKNIDFSNNSILIDRSFNSNYAVFNTPKTGNERIVY